MYQDSEHIKTSEDERNLQAGRFRTFGKENFQPDLDSERNLLNVVKENSKFLSFSLSSEISEVFIRLEEAPLYWVYDSPLIQYLEDFLKFHVISEGLNEHYRTIKEFYSKWAIIKQEAERQYFSSSAVRIIDKFNNNKNNFMYKIFHGIILIYEKTMQNPEKGIELLAEAKNIILNLKMNDKFKDETLYIINIFVGFAYLKLDDLYNATEQFQMALASKPYGVTSKFYLAYSEIKSSNFTIAKSLVEEILAYDITRAQQGVEAASIGMFNYLNAHCVFKNIFFYDAFSPLINDIEEMVANYRDKFKRYYSNFKVRFEKLNTLKLSDYYNDDILKYLSFFSKYELSTNKNNLLNLSASEVMNSKLDFCLATIMEAIRAKFYLTLAEDIKLYDAQLLDAVKHVEKTNIEITNEKETFKEKLSAAISDIEKQISDEVQNVEEQINNLHLDKSVDAKSAFASTMTYNFVISSIVFLMGGSVGFSGSSRPDELNSVLSQIVSTGLKWAAISFLLGFIISLVSSGMAIVERQNKRQRLIQRITYLKAFKERKIEAVKSEHEKKNEMILSTLKSRLEKYLEKQVTFIKERQEAEVKFKKEIEDKIAAESEHLRPLMPIPETT